MPTIRKDRRNKLAVQPPSCKHIKVFNRASEVKLQQIHHIKREIAQMVLANLESHINLILKEKDVCSLTITPVPVIEKSYFIEVASGLMFESMGIKAA